ncbi:MAG: UDP-N-acetylmuramoyl-L-alanine--D-glutamate ligase [Bdellovibrionaceae bacterium]|nr:UDP-N-acetylmuramoyl-L-alanine--D-glutamate ligase [Pseudobdellovibrionaceae bacterium]
MGLSGRSILNLLIKAGVPRDQVLTYDRSDPSASDSEEAALLAKNPKSLIVSPGVPLATPWIQDFRRNGGQITSELEIAFSFLKAEKVIAVTGSVGKSTTVALLQSGLNQFAPHAFVGGNLGFPLADYISALFEGRPRADWIALELSSYQLENFDNLRADAAIITSLTPNHLNRYTSLQHYYDTKWTLVSKTKGPIILNSHGGDLPSYAQKKPGPWIWSSSMSPEFLSFPFHEAKLVGHHNYDNLSLVIRLARELGWPECAIEGFLEFSGLPHRLENLGLIHGLRVINDSKATTLESVQQAVHSTENLTSGTTHILIGGQDKNLPWEELKTLERHRRSFVFFGECGPKAAKDSGLKGPLFDKLGPAIDHVLREAQAGDLILFSPGGTSWDEFKSFEARGDYFKNRISEYSKSPNPRG